MNYLKNSIIKYRDAEFHSKLNKFALSPVGFALQIVLALIIVFTDFRINGVAIFGFIGIFMLILCSDLIVLALPLLLTSVFVCECYDSAEKFLSFIIPEAVIGVLAIIFHLLVYKRKFVYGKSLYGLIAVSIATALSGLFCISAEEYFSPSALYYTLFLGIGMVGIYFILNAYTPTEAEYDREKFFTLIMYITGLFAAFSVFFHYIEKFSQFIASPSILDFQSSNNLSTFLLICLPFSFYYTIKHSKINIIGILFMISAIFASGSGGGLLTGAALMLICLVFAAVYDKKYRILWSVIIVGTLGIGVLAFQKLLDKYSFTSFDDIFYSNNMRISLIRRSLADFSSHPIFGVGLSYKGNTDIYSPKAGAMNWYHMMIPQIIGSMGLLGIAAYGYQFFVRIKIVLSHLDLYSVTLGLSYLGLFLMSQVNPGEFCPVPYSLIAVIIFIILERREKCTFRQYRQASLN